MKIEAWIFGVTTIFLALVAPAYWFTYLGSSSTGSRSRMSFSMVLRKRLFIASIEPRMVDSTASLPRGNNVESACGPAILGLMRFFHAVRQSSQHPGHQLSVRPTRQRRLLGLLHFRSRHQLHRLGNLAGVFNRLNAAADVAG